MKTLNERAFKLLEGVSDKTGGVEKNGVLLVDVGVEKKIDDPADVGACVASASTGCLSSIQMRGGVLDVEILKNPAVATLGCQLAGWRIAHGCYASGPARILSRKPKDVFEKIGYIEVCDKAAAVIECGSLPSADMLAKIMKACGVGELACACFKPESRVGVINVLARVVEMAFFQLDNVGYDTTRVVKASGSVPFSNVVTSEDANDAIIYDGIVSIETRGWYPDLGQHCVSRDSMLYGKRFAEVLSDAGGDFFNVDFSFFAPSRLEVFDVDTGENYASGETV